jgi:hypothetical protein
VSRLESALTHLVADLDTLGLRWALVGGIAVSARSRPRTTEDLDVVLAVQSDREAEKAAFSLRRLGYFYLPEEHALEQEESERLMTVRLLAGESDARGIVVDLLFASSGIEPEIVAQAEPIEVLPGLVVPVARTGHLIALKVLAGREIDARDTRWLWEVADESERALAREALAEITQRGFNRRKDLPAELAKVLTAGVR